MPSVSCARELCFMHASWVIRKGLATAPPVGAMLCSATQPLQVAHIPLSFVPAAAPASAAVPAGVPAESQRRGGHRDQRL